LKEVLSRERLFPFFSPANEAKRQAVNTWIRMSGWYDGVIDFDRVLRDPNSPTRLLINLDSGDHLHPNDAGYQAMADAVDLKLFN
jgi:lysophospholipase L1-like esterase